MMKYFIKKKNKQMLSFEVIRAVSRLNSHANKLSSQSIVWNGKGITNLFITS